MSDLTGIEETGVSEGGAAGVTADELAAVRELVLRAHPDAVPEMVGGETIGAVIASVEGARAAYQRIAERVAASPGREAADGATITVAALPVVPAGGAPRPVLDPEVLPAAEKIRRGLAATRG